jgi:2-keto-4-pentenoate hydratase/2-oxohepta-3-ene-1,7-dioic acid hydratase in catechol pathway
LFAPLEPSLIMSQKIPDPNCRSIRPVLNGEALQNSNPSDMIFDARTFSAFLSGSTTRMPGTVIKVGRRKEWGSRQAARFLLSGDSIIVEIDRIGALTNLVLGESTPVPA